HHGGDASTNGASGEGDLLAIGHRKKFHPQVGHNPPPLDYHRPPMSRLLSLAVTGTLLLLSDVAAADPQANAGLTIGGAGVGTGGEFWDDAEFHLGLRSDVMFLRDDPWDFGLGPYVELGTLAF